MMADVEVPEKTTAYLSVTFKDKNGQAQAPSSASYRIDDVGSDTEIKADTSLSPAPTVEITITSDENQILDQTNAEERRLVTVIGTYGVSDKVTGRYVYSVINLKKVT